MTGLGELLTVREVAELTGYSAGHVRKLLAAGVIAGERIGYTWLVPAGETEKLAKRRGARSRARARDEGRAEP